MANALNGVTNTCRPRFTPPSCRRRLRPRARVSRARGRGEATASSATPRFLLATTPTSPLPELWMLDLVRCRRVAQPRRIEQALVVSVARETIRPRPHVLSRGARRLLDAQNSISGLGARVGNARVAGLLGAPRPTALARRGAILPPHQRHRQTMDPSLPSCRRRWRCEGRSRIVEIGGTDEILWLREDDYELIDTSRARTVVPGTVGQQRRVCDSRDPHCRHMVRFPGAFGRSWRNRPASAAVSRVIEAWVNGRRILVRP